MKIVGQEPEYGMRFFYQFEDGAPKIEMLLHRDSDLADVLMSFGDFLRAAGYSFKGQVDVVEDGEGLFEEEKTSIKEV